MRCVDCAASPAETTVPDPRCRACAGRFFQRLLKYAIHHRDDPRAQDPRYTAAVHANYVTAVLAMPPKKQPRVPAIDVVQLRDRYAAGETQDALAVAFQLSPMNVYQIVTGRSWKHAGGPISTWRLRDVA